MVEEKQYYITASDDCKNVRNGVMKYKDVRISKGMKKREKEKKFSMGKL